MPNKTDAPNPAIAPRFQIGITGAGSVIRIVRPMRLLLFGLLIVLCGCATVVTQDPQLVFPAREKPAIYVHPKSSHELLVSITEITGDKQQVSLLPDESSLTDAAGQRYHLEFHLDYSPGNPTAFITYSMCAFGPLPAASQHSFNRSP